MVSRGHSRVLNRAPHGSHSGGTRGAASLQTTERSSVCCQWLTRSLRYSGSKPINNNHSSAVTSPSMYPSPHQYTNLETHPGPVSPSSHARSAYDQPPAAAEIDITRAHSTPLLSRTSQRSPTHVSQARTPRHQIQGDQPAPLAPAAWPDRKARSHPAARTGGPPTASRRRRSAVELLCAAASINTHARVTGHACG